MFIHNFCRLQEGVNPIHPVTTLCEANVTYMRYLMHIGSRRGVPILCFAWIFFGVGWLGTHDYIITPIILKFDTDETFELSCPNELEYQIKKLLSSGCNVKTLNHKG